MPSGNGSRPSTLAMNNPLPPKPQPGPSTSHNPPHKGGNQDSQQQQKGEQKGNTQNGGGQKRNRNKKKNKNGNAQNGGSQKQNQNGNKKNKNGNTQSMQNGGGQQQQQQQSKKKNKKQRKDEQRKDNQERVEPPKPPEPTFPQFTRLSDETQKRVFNFAYQLDYVGLAILARISRQTNQWFGPLIYRDIILGTNQASIKLRATFDQGLKSKDYYRSQVKTILASDFGVGDGSLIVDLLSTCDNISTFACWNQHVTQAVSDKILTFLETKELPSLRHLILWAWVLTPHHFRLPVFQNLTHLALEVTLDDKFPWEELKGLLDLTHLMLRMSFDIYSKPKELRCDILGVLPYLPPSLKYFIALVDYVALWEAAHRDNEDDDCEYSRWGGGEDESDEGESGGGKGGDQTGGGKSEGEDDIVPDDAYSVFLEINQGKLDKRIVLAAHGGSNEELDPEWFNEGEEQVGLRTIMRYTAWIPKDGVPWLLPLNGKMDDVWTRAEDVVFRRENPTKEEDSKWKPWNPYWC